MEAIESVKIIEQMLKESRQSLSKNSFYFILWAVLLIPCGIIEWYLFDTKYEWIGWPIAGTIGAIIAVYYGMKQEERTEVKTIVDKGMNFVWGAFGICLLYCIVYTTFLKVQPHALILLIAGGATFTTGGLSKFTPFVIGGLFLVLTAILCGFVVEPAFQGLVFAIGLTGGYLIPGLILRKQEYGKA